MFELNLREFKKSLKMAVFILDFGEYCNFDLAFK